MIIVDYNRIATVNYSKEWALKRNPNYFNFNSIGGDCTNFASQCIYAGSGIMNYSRNNGWYYNSINDRAPAWTSAEYFRRFLLTNNSVGPFGIETALYDLEIGDIISLYNGNEYYHSLVVVDMSRDVPLVCAHTDDSYMRRFDTYYYESFSPIHIIGVRKN